MASNAIAWPEESGLEQFGNARKAIHKDHRKVLTPYLLILLEEITTAIENDPSTDPVDGLHIFSTAWLKRRSGGEALKPHITHYKKPTDFTLTAENMDALLKYQRNNILWKRLVVEFDKVEQRKAARRRAFEASDVEEQKSAEVKRCAQDFMDGDYSETEPIEDMRPSPLQNALESYMSKLEAATVFSCDEKEEDITKAQLLACLRDTKDVVSALKHELRLTTWKTQALVQRQGLDLNARQEHLVRSLPLWAQTLPAEIIAMSNSTDALVSLGTLFCFHAATESVVSLTLCYFLDFVLDLSVFRLDFFADFYTLSLTFLLTFIFGP